MASHLSLAAKLLPRTLQPLPVSWAGTLAGGEQQLCSAFPYRGPGLNIKDAKLSSSDVLFHTWRRNPDSNILRFGEFMLILFLIFLILYTSNTVLCFIFLCFIITHVYFHFNALIPGTSTVQTSNPKFCCESSSGVRKFVPSAPILCSDPDTSLSPWREL